MGYRAPLVTLSDLVGPSNTLASVNVDLEQTINGYVESTQPGNAKVPQWLSKRPGVSPHAVFSDTPSRGLFEINGRLFGVSGEVFGEIFQNGTITEYGAIADDADHTPCSFATNGSAGDQLMIVGGGNGYIFDLGTNTLAIIADTDFPNGSAKMCEFMDGYFIVLIADSRRFQISALEDGTDWDALDVAERSIAPDNINAIKRNHRDLLILGEQTSESWYDNGDPLFPFAPSQGVLMEQGSVAAFGPVRCDNTLIFPVKDERGSGVVSRMDGYTNVRTTTYAIDHLVQASTTLDQSVGFSFQFNGHLFYCLTGEDFSNSEGAYTLVYDVAEQLWYLWAEWNSTTGLWEPFIGKYHAFAFNTHYFGSRTNGYVYAMSDAYFEDRIVA